MTYLGLILKKRAQAEQQDQHDGTSSWKHGAGNEAFVALALCSLLYMQILFTQKLYLAYFVDPMHTNGF